MDISVLFMMDNIIEQYKRVAQISEVKEGHILSVSNDDNSLFVTSSVTWSCQNLSSFQRSSFASVYVTKSGHTSVSPPVLLESQILLRSYSHDGGKVAQLMEGKDDLQQLLVMANDGQAFSINLKDADCTGKAYGNDTFGCLKWSPDDSKIVFVAEKKLIKGTNFLSKPKEKEDGRGLEYLAYDNWGEQLQNCCQAVVAVADLVTKDISVLTLPGHLFPGKLEWTPDGGGVVGVAFLTEPYKLGVIYCPNRDSVLYFMDLEGKYTELLPKGQFVSSVSFSPDGKLLTALTAEVGGPHAKGRQLWKFSWPFGKPHLVVDLCDRERKTVNGKPFRGIYSCHSHRCWSADSRCYLFSTIVDNHIVPFCVNMVTMDIVELPHTKSCQILDVHKDVILCECASFNTPSQLLIGLLPEPGKEDTLNWIPLNEPIKVPGVMDKLVDDWSFVNSVPHPIPQYSELPVQVLYVGPSELSEGQSKCPLICMPHGGPHSARVNHFDVATAFFLALGYGLVFPNYRGSLGQGEDSIKSLPGHCGDTDVKDVFQAVQECLTRFGDVLDSSRVYLCGGSHGGFLVTHLSAQYPEFFTAVATRNPVIDLSSMYSSSDIPDWTFIESGSQYKIGQVATGEELVRMQNMSPISLVGSVKAPTLLMIGTGDLRVPPKQGIAYHKCLQARGVKTRLHMYDDCHALRKVPHELDCLINIALWFDEHR